MRVVLTGGPSGGHVFPALALAEELRDTEPGIEIHTLLPERLFFKHPSNEKALGTLHYLPGIGLDISRPWRFPAVGYEFFKLCRMFFRLLDSIKPSAVVSFGTFMTLPGVWWAKRRGVPAVIHEQNVVLGRANTAAVLWARYVAFGMTEVALPVWRRSDVEVRLTGQLLRREIKELTIDAIQSNSAFTLLIVGGSQGSRSLNDFVLDSLRRWQGDEKTVHVIHITGEKDFQRAQTMYRKTNFGHEVYPFSDGMSSLYAKANVVLGRAGAGIISECAHYAKPLILLPFRSAHQQGNARFLERKGAAVVVEDNEAGHKKFLSVLGQLRDQVAHRLRMGEALRSTVGTNGASELTGWLFEILAGKKVYA